MVKRRKTKINWIYPVVIVAFIVLFMISAFSVRPETEVNAPIVIDICEIDPSQCRDPSGEDPWIPIDNCGNNICEPDEWHSDGDTTTIMCSDDCSICDIKPPVCGNGTCEVYCGVDEFESCRNDCGGIGDPDPDPGEPWSMSNEELLELIRQKVRPLVGGIQIRFYSNETTFGQCSLGAIVPRNGEKYVLTAGHCITDNDIPISEDIGNVVMQGDEILGYVSVIDDTDEIDVALISIETGVDALFENILKYKIEGFQSPYVGLEVFKVGRTTGMTFGTVTKVDGFYGFDDGREIRNFSVASDGIFCEDGDSGSAIVTASPPYKIVGIISTGNEEACHSNWPEDIKNVMGIDWEVS